MQSQPPPPPWEREQAAAAQVNAGTQSKGRPCGTRAPVSGSTATLTTSGGRTHGPHQGQRATRILSHTPRTRVAGQASIKQKSVHMALFGKGSLQCFAAIAHFAARLAAEKGSEKLFVHSLNQ